MWGGLEEQVTRFGGSFASQPPPDLSAFVSAFSQVYFVPGNHDVWLRAAERDAPGAPPDSLAKWARLEQSLNARGVRTRPARLAGTSDPAHAPWIVPLLSWYSAEWDTEPDVLDAPPARSIFTDFRACVWPPSLAAADSVGDGGDVVSAAWDSLNDDATLAAVAAGADSPTRPPIIAAAHFLPSQALLPEKRYLFQPNLAKVSGSIHLARRLAALRPDVCIGGHTHLDYDFDVALTPTTSVRCIQRSLRYPSERRRAGLDVASVTPQLVWCEREGWGPRADPHWSVHYRVHDRTPANVAPAPWVLAAWGRK